jgi:hypothetical protein
VMMLAEKAADLIIGNTPLPPSEAPFYRYRDGDPLYPPTRSTQVHPTQARSTQARSTQGSST